MINKERFGITKNKVPNKQINKQGSGQFGGGPDNYDGTSNTNAGVNTAELRQNDSQSPAKVVVTD